MLRGLWRILIMATLSSAGHGQVLELKLDGTLEGQAAGKQIVAELGPGAKLVPSAEGQGVEPGAEGPAVKIPVPDALWQPAGTLAFRFMPSRTIRFNPEPTGERKVVLVDCPALSAELSETRYCSVLSVALPSGETYKPKGRIDLSHLKGGRWYHLAFAWDAEKGKLEAYLNGVLQEPLRLREPFRAWKPAAKLSGPLNLGGTLGSGDVAARIAIDSVELYPAFMDEDAVAATLAGRNVEALAGEGRTKLTGPLDLSPYKLDLIYEADFTQPLNVAMEDELFDGDRRVRLPEGKEWVFEGPGKAWTDGGQLHLETFKPEAAGHVVLWNTRAFPANFLLEFGMSPKDSNCGLNILFFCARSRDGGSVFDLELPKRAGEFKNYHSGALNNYHISYWACDAVGGHRRTANLRKNFGFYLPTCGPDHIAGHGAGPHRVRLLKVGGKIRLETRDALSVAFDDDGATYGPIWGDGYIGLRQMGHTHRASYSHFKVWKVGQ